MSAVNSVKGKCGAYELTWLAVPRGRAGTARVHVAGTGEFEVRWKQDGDGLWIELPTGVHGFDCEGEANEEGQVTYRVTERGASSEWTGLAFVRAGDVAAASAGTGKKKNVRVRAQMPGKIVRILTRIGDLVERDQPLAVMEAMKMENEIKATQAGKISKVSAAEGQAVETGAELFVIDPV